MDGWSGLNGRGLVPCSLKAGNRTCYNENSISSPNLPHPLLQTLEIEFWKTSCFAQGSLCFANVALKENFHFVFSRIMRTHARGESQFRTKQFSRVLSHERHRRNKTYELFNKRGVFIPSGGGSRGGARGGSRPPYFWTKLRPEGLSLDDRAPPYLKAWI